MTVDEDERRTLAAGVVVQVLGGHRPDRTDPPPPQDVRCHHPRRTVVPPQTPHGFRNTGDAPLLVVSVHESPTLQQTFLGEDPA
jgi:hypothetical protein